VLEDLKRIYGYDYDVHATRRFPTEADATTAEA
jgi:hypothetical protein